MEDSQAGKAAETRTLVGDRKEAAIATQLSSDARA